MLKSPCKGVCKYDPEGIICVGCNRTKREISRWGTMTDGERKNVMTKLSKRSRNTN
ncbi:MAG: DUF1289 domain-containing protein [Gammaproteobacteria bacterium]|nr:DUF1289 domain-containing protein [Gammaproteobacteria bacterium]